jgi:hypothetical protein
MIQSILAGPTLLASCRQPCRISTDDTSVCWTAGSVVRLQQAGLQPQQAVLPPAAHLVITLACGAVAHCICTDLLGNLNLALGNQRPVAHMHSHKHHQSHREPTQHVTVKTTSSPMPPAQQHAAARSGCSIDVWA